MEKPKEIIEFEKKYNILMTELSHIYEIYETKNSFLCDDNRQIIGLNLRNNQLNEIPNLSFYPLLQFLILCDNQISEIKGLEVVTQLTELDLNLNRISEIKGLDHLVRLKVLKLSKNEIKIVKGLNNLNLITLELYDNHFYIKDYKNNELDFIIDNEHKLILLKLGLIQEIN